MPKRTPSKPSTSSPPPRPKAPKRQKAANGHKLPEPIPAGEILTDVKGGQWRLGKSVGIGGFGEIYLASNDVKKPTQVDAKYVIKIEPHSNGPLFTEMHFYHRVGKAEDITAWMKKKNLKFLGMPKLIGSGSHEFKNTKYRFMVIERFGEDLQKLLERNRRTFPVKTVYTLGLKVIHVLEYIHSHGYIHADVKASNLMSGYGKEGQNNVYLIDFGLSCRYMSNGVHKEYKEDLRKAHDGTIEFTSRDAHIGAHSRRGDLEILAYNMLQWLCGRLPWEDNLKDPNFVSSQKTKYMKDIPSLMKECFPTSPPPQGISEFFKYVASLQFDEEPKYERCQNILSSAIKSNGFKDDGQLIYVSKRNSTSPTSSRKRPLVKASESGVEPKLRKYTESPRKITSESSPLRVPSSKRVRLISSAKPGLQLPAKAAKSPDTIYSCGFDKPTPAMLEVIKRKAESMKSPQLANRNGIDSKARTNRKGSREKLPPKKSESPQSSDSFEDYRSSDSDVIENIKPNITQAKKRIAATKSKAPVYKTKKRSPVTSRMRLKVQNNSCSL